ncbi:exodeoxyribonuclease V subunit beta [Buchnera aphidicola]|uniref:RecBCD enzyme subunit RecB n=1 Tax=Buchnera aphidicola (Cinara strobi) TaxID=1921549 RepID=A0A3B1E9L1_9GAMM|nr:exodeoxyribonuclease V subunit beta [Buchnera aphidicola]VAX76719.1 RecBCD enzyme subunit RecB [Buchnera aphidicola (Cinara strobi)]
MKYIPFNTKEIPNYGISLIEASAGTGKTFSIILIYLRLILNIGIKKSYSRPLSINEILIVTFTRASKNELKQRIKKKIYQLYEICTYQKKEIKDLEEIVQEIKDFKKISKILKKVKKNIDLIMIYTVHSFFRYILLEQKFLCKKIISKKILPNIKKIQLDATKDFWRKYIYILDKNIVNLLFDKWKTPEKLLEHIYLWINQIDIKFKYNFDKKISLKKQYNNIVEIIKITKSTWNQENKEIKKLIRKLPLNKKIYNKKRITEWFQAIESWSNQTTSNHFTPKILKYFQFKKIFNNNLFKRNKEFYFFNCVEKIFKTHNLFFEYFIYLSLKEIPKIIQKKKIEKKGLEFNDLNKIMWAQIKSKKSKIKKNILKKYTVTIIDECQDIDDIQFNVFYFLYNNTHKKSLLLIGDPKQSIYSFRGSNIFLYLKFKKKIKKCFFLNTNFRSSHNVVKGINILFSRFKNPFILKEINFQPSKVNLKNKTMQFIVNNKEQAAFNFIINHKKKLTVQEYYSWASKECANSIHKWLSNQYNKKSFIVLKNQKKRSIKKNDITILVKNKYEASIIQKELEKKNIQSIYTSQKNNIFHTIEAKEIMQIIDSIIDLSNESKFQKLLMTEIFKKNIYDIYQINKKKKEYYFFLEKLKKYYIIWKNDGISKMIEKIILDYNIYKSHTNKKNNNLKTRIFLKLSDILEKKNKIIENKFLLLVWFKRKILKKEIKNGNEVKEEEQILDHLEYIKIITVHKSKGLEYPIVWIPFFSHRTIKNNQIFYCRKKFKKIVDLKNSKDSKILSNQETFSEEIRLLYVALTRCILHCSIGIAVIKNKRIQKECYTNFHQNSLSFIIQKGKKNTFNNFIKNLYKINTKKIINIQKTSKKKKIIYKKNFLKEKLYFLPKTLRIIKHPWNKISFSKILKYNFKYKKEVENKQNGTNKSIILIKKINYNKVNIFNFPAGKIYGIYIHDVLKKIDFQKKDNIIKIIKKLNFISLSNKWMNYLFKWLCMFISSPLNEKNLSLNQLKKSNCQKEIKFILPIEDHLKINELNKVMKMFDPLSAKCPDIYFQKTSGIITGIIDLIFYWNKKYYIIEYKSNWLGPNKNYYTHNNIQKEIMQYRYDLQYQIYSLSIHRYLKNKIKDYQYHIHFGGIFYLFIRGINNKDNTTGIYFFKPPYNLIYQIDNLLHGAENDTKK